jgi:hypothetical protein
VSTLQPKDDWNVSKITIAAMVTVFVFILFPLYSLRRQQAENAVNKLDHYSKARQMIGEH